MRSIARITNILMACGLAACHTWVQAPVGTTAAPLPAAPFDYPAATTHANGWRPGEDDTHRRVADEGYSTALAAFQQVAAKRDPFRVAVYYNRTMMPAAAAVRRPSEGTLEVDYGRGSAGGPGITRTIRFYTGDEQSGTTVGAQNVNAIVAQQLETAIIGHLTDGNARVVDKDLLIRNAATVSASGSYGDAELRALSRDVDLVLEVTFLPSATASDGFALGVRAIRTRDAAIVAQVSSAELEGPAATSGGFAAVEGGYAVRTVSLRALCHSVMQETMTQIAARY